MPAWFLDTAVVVVNVVPDTVDQTHLYPPCSAVVATPAGLGMRPFLSLISHDLCLFLRLELLPMLQLGRI